MATETVASDHTSATDEQIVKKEKSEAIAQMIASLANEDEDKHDEPEDAQGQATPSSKTEGEAEGDDKKAEPAVVVEKTDDPVSLEATHDAAKSGPEEPPSTESTVKETPQQLEKESTETQEEKQSKAADIPEASADANPLTESEAKVVKEAEILETREEKPEPEPEPTQVQEKTEEPKKESQEKPQETDQPSTVAIPKPSAEANEKLSDAIEVKTREPSAEVLKETNDYESGPTETVKTEPVVTEVQENQTEPEKQSFEHKEEVQPNTTAIPQVPSAQTSEAIEEETRELELKETNNYEAEEAETVVSEEEEKQPKTVTSETAAESAEKAGDIIAVHPPREIGTSEPEAVPEKAEKPVVVHPPKESDIEVVKETDNSESEEKPEPVSTEVEEKPRELLEEATKIKGASDDTISLKEEKTDKAANTTQVSLNGEARAVPANPQVTGKVVEEDGKKESNFTEGVSKEAAGVIQIPEQASTDQEAKTGLREEREYSVPTTFDEKVAVAANDGEKEPEAHDAVEGSSREAHVKDEAKTATTEAGGVKVESVKDDNEREGHTDTKVDEISSAVSEPLRETLASKFEEEESTKTGVDNLEKDQTGEPVKTEGQVPEPPKESDATKTSKDLPKETPAKPAQKQSNNIISKVKQSLVKARKAITGKSPSSKNPPSETKDDIKVK